MTSGIIENRAIREKKCPRHTCQAPAGVACYGPGRSGAHTMHPHKERVDLVRADIADQGAPGWPPKF